MLPTVKYPDPILTTPCRRVNPDDFGPDLNKLLDDMAETMKAENGIGLAANQVGVPRRVFIMLDQKGKLWEFVNPRITEREGFQQINEGCLSAPGAFVSVPRAASITVVAQDRNREEFTVVCYEIEAVCVQHEIDHLDGIFYLEKTTRNQRRAALKTLGLK